MKTTVEKYILISTFLGYRTSDDYTQYKDEFGYWVEFEPLNWGLIMEAVGEINRRVFAGGILYELRDALITANLEKAFEEVVNVIEIINNRKH